MNEELQQALAELINKSVAVGESAIAFTQAQLPEVIQQLLLWNAATSVLATMVWILAAAFVATTPKALAALDWSGYEPDLPQVIGAARGVCAFFVTIALIVRSGAPEWLQIWLAPKVYLIEYAASLAK